MPVLWQTVFPVQTNSWDNPPWGWILHLVATPVKWIPQFYIFGVSSYTFLFPHYFLYKCILEEKRFQLNKLDIIIKAYQSRLDDLSREELERMKQFIELREKISSTKNSLIDPSGWSQYLTSLIFPTLSFIGGTVDVKSIVKNIIR
jgi:hypothetical protein